MVLASMEIPQLLFDTVVNAHIMPVVQVFIPVVALRLTPMVLTAQQTIVAPQLLYMLWSMSLFSAVVL